MVFKNAINRILLGLVTFVVSFSASAQVKWDMYAFSGVSHPVTMRLKDFAEEVKKEN